MVNPDVITTTDIKQASEIAKLFSDDLVSHINKLKRAADEAEKEFEMVISPLLKLKNALSSRESKEGLSVAIGKTHQTVSEAQQSVHTLARIVEFLKDVQDTQATINTANEAQRNVHVLVRMLGLLKGLDEPSVIKDNEESATMLLTASNLSKDKSNMKTSYSGVLNTALAEQLNIDQKKLKDILNQLSSRWCNPKNKLTDTEGYRLVTDFIIKKLNNPLTFSMLADDTANFKKNFQEEDGDILCFEFCCICGSEKIINEVYLKDKEKVKCLALSEHAIAYALSSGNQNLTIQLAKKGVELGKKNPGHTGLYCFGDYKAVKNVKEIFALTEDVGSKKYASLS